MSNFADISVFDSLQSSNDCGGVCGVVWNRSPLAERSANVGRGRSFLRLDSTRFFNPRIKSLNKNLRYILQAIEEVTPIVQQFSLLYSGTTRHPASPEQKQNGINVISNLNQNMNALAESLRGHLAALEDDVFVPGNFMRSTPAA